MKKIMTLMLALSFIAGATVSFAKDDTTTTTKKMKKTKKKTTTTDSTTTKM